MQLLPLGGTTRLPPLAALGWIIAYYVEFGKRGRAAATPGVPLIRPLRGHLPPWVGKAGAVCRGALGCRWRSPHPSRLRRATFPQGKALGGVRIAASLRSSQ